MYCTVFIKIIKNIDAKRRSAMQRPATPPETERIILEDIICTWLYIYNVLEVNPHSSWIHPSAVYKCIASRLTRLVRLRTLVFRSAFVWFWYKERASERFHEYWLLHIRSWFFDFQLLNTVFLLSTCEVTYEFTAEENFHSNFRTPFRNFFEWPNALNHRLLLSPSIWEGIWNKITVEQIA